ncbi:hypothetical protein KZZ52_20875 [Dactylosporangium sp. AC04546]|uniref:hypothetical protein n=1 Tax=Dactylosporangium sp. AC04546 TaxID=2862460 RepID=UPI001EE0E32E|nr:hypothetical protein [Dactylosporangium sp. AC04546]WVK87741.1 hypothetical protein KZZ52_20875 [Dactylosporangium sp. AC04546]
MFAGPTVPGEDRRNGVSVAAQADPDRWWFGIGEETADHEEDGARAQITQQYVWGITADAAQRSIWWGTVGNVTGSGFATVAPDFADSGLGVPLKPWDDPDNVTVEFSASYNAVHGVPPTMGPVGDAVPAQVWQYDIGTGVTVERTPTEQQCPVLRDVAGLRAAGALGDVVLIGGIETTTEGGAQAGGTVVLLAYRASDGEFLGWRRFPQWNNIKNFIVAGGRLYFGVALAQSEDGITGSVQRLRSPADPFEFEEVGRLGNQPTYFTVHRDRLITGTWAGAGSEEHTGVYLSPPLHRLGPQASDEWRLVFSAAQLFPDPITARSMVSFAVTSFGGWVYATFGIPSIEPSFTRHLAAHPEIPRETIPDLALAYLKSSPAGVVYRIKDPGEVNQQVELLYGEERYWVYEPGGVGWALRDNLLHQKPRFGGGGFGDRWNDYVGWGAAVFRGKLYVRATTRPAARAGSCSSSPPAARSRAGWIASHGC